MEPIYKAKVHADNDYPVKMREQASTQSNVLAKIPQGAIVDVLGIIGSDEGDWGFISYNDQIGYMLNKFLLPINDGGTNEEDVTVLRNELEYIETTLEGLIERVKKVTGK